MPKQIKNNPIKLEDQCMHVYLNNLHDEMHLMFYLKNFQDRSVILRQRQDLAPDKLYDILQHQISNNLQGILHDIVRQKMLDILISQLHLFINDMHKMFAVGRPPAPLYLRQDVGLSPRRNINHGGDTSSNSTSASGGPWIPGSHGFRMVGEGPAHIRNDYNRAHDGISGHSIGGGQGNVNNPLNSNFAHGSNSNIFSTGSSKYAHSIQQYRALPIFQLFELILHKDLHNIDLSQNKEWIDSDQMHEVARTLWKIISEKCTNLRKFIVPKELVYSSTMNAVIQNGGRNLTHLTLKRNVPNNTFLSIVGQNCPNLNELDIAGADIVTDFGVVCLLFVDHEQIFEKCWNREKTVGSVRKSQRCFGHPHFDKPIPDPTDMPTGTKNLTQFLHLKKSFHEAIRDPTHEWELYPICQSLLKLRLENTKVKGDGASVVLECCPNLYSLGYLVFAAAGLKQVYGYEEEHDTKFTEIFYRGPSDQKLQTISNCCRNLKTMFLGSNNVRRLNHPVFSRWQHLEYLTLENIILDDVPNCLEIIGRQLKGLKIQCCGFDLTDIAIFCPNLESLIIQKEVPLGTVNWSRVEKYGRTSKMIFMNLKHVEITCASFHKSSLTFIVKHALNILSIKLYSLPSLKREDIEVWIRDKCLQHLETFLIFQGREMNSEMAELFMENLPNLKKFGDFNSFDLRRPNDIKRFHSKIREEKWDIQLFDSQNPSTSFGEKDFNKLLTLHWFYLTDGPTNKRQ